MNIYSFLLSIYFKFTETHNSAIQKIKKSKIQVQNKTQTLRKSYTFLSKACTLSEHININNNTTTNNHNDNNKKQMMLFLIIIIVIIKQMMMFLMDVL